jgi:hypothetical protein
MSAGVLTLYWTANGWNVVGAKVQPEHVYAGSALTPEANSRVDIARQAALVIIIFLLTTTIIKMRKGGKIFNASKERKKHQRNGARYHQRLT